MFRKQTSGPQLHKQSEGAVGLDPAHSTRQWKQISNAGAETGVNNTFNHTSGRKEAVVKQQLVIQEIL